MPERENYPCHGLDPTIKKAADAITMVAPMPQLSWHGWQNYSGIRGSLTDDFTYAEPGSAF